MKAIPMNILVVDDDPDILFATARLLENNGYQVIQAETGLQAIELARRHQPDLVLLDVVLPDIRGTEVCRRLKAENATAVIPVIMVSSMKTLSEEQSHGLEAGADDYLTRPIPNRELLARIKAFMRLREAESHLLHQEKLLKTIVNGIRSELYLVDGAMRIQWANQATLEAAGLKEEELVGQTCHELFMHTTTPCKNCPAAITLNTRNPAEAIIPFPDGRTKHCKSEPIFDDDQQISTVLKIETDITDLLNTQEELNRHKDQLESLVSQRTEELRTQVAKREQTEKKLQMHAKKLEEKNIALNVLLENRDDNNKKMADTILKNFERLVFPYHEKIRGCDHHEDLQMLLKIIEKNTIESLSPLEGSVPQPYRRLTPSEIQVADLIRAGRTSKEIAGIMSMSERSVFFHRDNIRQKMGLKGTKTNLKSHLLSL